MDSSHSSGADVIVDAGAQHVQGHLTEEVIHADVIHDGVIHQEVIHEEVIQNLDIIEDVIQNVEEVIHFDVIHDDMIHHEVITKR